MQRKRGSPRLPEEDQVSTASDPTQSGGYSMGMAEYVVIASVLMAGAGVAVSMAKFAGHAPPDCMAAAPSGGGRAAALQTAG